MENVNEDLDILVQDLRDFLIKNDAELLEGQTFDSIVEEQIMPLVTKRKEEAWAMLMNSIKFLEEEDELMHEVSKNILNFYKNLGEKYDKYREK